VIDVFYKLRKKFYTRSHYCHHGKITFEKITEKWYNLKFSDNIINKIYLNIYI
jgi:hypothetical protein